MKKSITYLLSTGCIIAAASAMGAVASADATTVTYTDTSKFPVQISPAVEKDENKTAIEGYTSLDEALNAITKAKGTGSYTITLTSGDKDGNASIKGGYSTGEKVSLPKTAKSITIASNNAEKQITIDASGAAAIAANCDLTLENIKLVGGEKTKFTAKGNVTLTGSELSGSFAAVKGSKGKTLTTNASQMWAFDISGFGTVVIPEGVTIDLYGGAKKGGTFDTLQIDAGGQLNIYSKTVQANSVKGEGSIGYVQTALKEGKEVTTTDPSFLNIKKDIKNANIGLAYYTRSGEVKAAGTEWAGAEQNVFPTTKVLVSGDKSNKITDKFKFKEGAVTQSETKTVEETEVTTTTTTTLKADGTTKVSVKVGSEDAVESDGTSYTISLGKKDAYVRPVAFKYNIGDEEKSAATWDEVATAIQTKNAPKADYEIRIITDIDLGAAMKVPKKGTYGSITIKSGKSAADAAQPTADSENKVTLYETTNAESGTADTQVYKLNNVTYAKIGNDFYRISEVETGNKIYTYDSSTAVQNEPTGLEANASITGITVKDVASSDSRDDDTNASLKKASNDKYYYIFTTGSGASEKTWYCEVTITNEKKWVKGSKWEPTAPAAKLAFTGNISGTGDLALKDLIIKSYKLDKKAGTKNGTTSQISTKGTLTLDNVSLDPGTFVYKDGTVVSKAVAWDFTKGALNKDYSQTETATTLKGVSATKLNLKGTVEAVKVNATDLIVDTGEKATIVANSIGFKGSVSGDKDSITISICDKSDTSAVGDLSKTKISVGTYGGQFADIEYTETKNSVTKVTEKYAWAFSGKTLVPVAYTVLPTANDDNDKTKTINEATGFVPTYNLKYEDTVTVGEEEQTVQMEVKFKDIKDVSTYLANAAKSKPAMAKKNYTLVMPEAPSKFTLPKSGTYASLKVDAVPTVTKAYKAAEGEAAEVSEERAAVEIELKSLKLTGTLETTENVKLTITGKDGKPTGGKFTDGYAIAMSKKAADDFKAAVNELETAMNSAKVDVIYDDADKKTTFEAKKKAVDDIMAGAYFSDSYEYDGEGATEATAAFTAAVTKYGNIKAAYDFYKANKALLDKLIEANKEKDATGEKAEAVYEAYKDDLSSGAKAYLSKEVTKEHENAVVETDSTPAKDAYDWYKWAAPESQSEPESEP